MSSAVFISIYVCYYLRHIGENIADFSFWVRQNVFFERFRNVKIGVFLDEIKKKYEFPKQYLEYSQMDIKLQRSTTVRIRV